MRSTINFVTGSKNKVTEMSQALGKDFEIKQLDVDLPEIQPQPTLRDSESVIEFKLQQARKLYPELKMIVAEDVSFEIDELHGLPGPLVKYFENAPSWQGDDDPTAGMKLLYKMARGIKPKGKLSGRAIAILGLVVGDEYHYFRGECAGEIVEPGDVGWGFDLILVPEGYDRRMGDIGAEIKSQISHRARVAQQLRSFLESA